jgi:hypothetical protein
MNAKRSVEKLLKNARKSEKSPQKKSSGGLDKNQGDLFDVRRPEFIMLACAEVARKKGLPCTITPEEVERWL